MGKCNDCHIPTCTLDNNLANLLFHMLALLLHMEVLNQHDAWIIGKSSTNVDELYFASPEWWGIWKCAPNSSGFFGLWGDSSDTHVLMTENHSWMIVKTILFEDQSFVKALSTHSFDVRWLIYIM